MKACAHNLRPSGCQTIVVTALLLAASVAVAMAPSTTLVSVNSAGTASGESNSYGWALTPNGRFVAFESLASDLVGTLKLTTACGGGPCVDVFVRDLKLGTTTLVSVSPILDITGDSNSFFPAITPNGRFVVFGSDANILVSTPKPQVFCSNAENATNDHTCADVFVRDLKLGTTTLVSVNRAGTASGNNDSISNTNTLISDNGRFVVFDSAASDLVAAPKGNASTVCDNSLAPFSGFGGTTCPDVFVRDLKLGTTALVSVNSAGTASGNDQSFSHGLTPNGRFVAFESAASDLVTTPKGSAPNTCSPDFGGGACIDVFVRDLKLGTTTLVSVNSAGTASGDDDSLLSAITPNGRFVTFSSRALSLVAMPKGTNAAVCGGFPCPDVFVRDLKLGTTTLVSVNNAGTASGNNQSSGIDGAITPKGRFVGFNGSASDLVSTPKGNATACNGGPCSDVFVRDLKFSTTTLVSVNSAATASGNNDSVLAGLSSNGRFVMFSSLASDLVSTPKGNATACNGGPCRDVFVRDLKLGTTTLVSVNSAGTASGNNQTFADAFSPNGQFVLFDSLASDPVPVPMIVPCGGGPCENVFVRQLR